ncbi:pilus assembly protein PilQ [Pectinatus frisingensis]|uniref:pilus assembly protein PilQ n=1 Tax=Pectinatus frisingensis TaxID=865 RepID=UPI001E334856|nr:pilus assembly protein PilQ [Pectinatus frisingensis]
MHLKYMIITAFLLWLLPCPSFAMSLRVSDADIRYIFTALAADGNINIILNDDVSGIVSANLTDITALDAIKLIAKSNGFSVEQTNNTLFIGKNHVLNNTLGSLHIFKLQHISPVFLTNTLKIFSYTANKSSTDNNKPDKTINFGPAIVPTNNTWIDSDNNTVIFYGTDGDAAEIAAFIKRLDVPVKQVMLEAKVIAIQKDASKKLGIEWNWSQLPQTPDIETSYTAIKHSVINPDGSRSTVTEDIPSTKTTRHYNSSIPGIIQFGKGPENIPFEFYYGATINALITDGKANILAKPNIMTLNNHEAVIAIGGSIPIPKVSVTDSTTTTSYEYHDTGIILRYTPFINDNGDITAAVHTEVSSPLYVEDLKAYRFQKRSADTTVRLKDGETMIIGGLIGSEEAKNISKIPFLGDLPILGNFFRSTKTSKSESEIIIFLTAHIQKNQ